MPARLKRYQNTGDLHFLTFSCYKRAPYLTAYMRDHFVHSLEHIRARYQVDIHAYVVMPEHVHLLTSEPHHASLATFVQALKLSVARKACHGPFWAHRYYDFNVFTERKQIEKRRYMHRNPVTRGLVAAPESWSWSSFQHWLTGESGRVHLTSRWTTRGADHACFASPKPTSQNRDVGHPGRNTLAHS